MLTTLSLRFFWCSGILTALLFLVLVWKRLLQKHMTVQARYGISKFMLLLYVLPFVPVGLTNRIGELLLPLIRFVGSNLPKSDEALEIAVQTPFQEQVHETGVFIAADSWMRDFAVTVQRTENSAFWLVAAIFFGIGAGILFLAAVSAGRGYHILRKRAEVPDQNLIQIFESCKSQTDESCKLQTDKSRRPWADKRGTVRKVELLLTPFLRSPVTFGIFRPVVLLPFETLQLPERQLRHILLHELQHCRRKDAAVNLAMCIVRCVYWFNPLVWYYLAEMETERELSCDAAVLDLLGGTDSLAYGATLLAFARMGRPAGPIFRSVVSEMSSSGKQLRIRILSISGYKKVTASLRVKSILSVALIVLITFCGVPCFGAYEAGPKPPYSVKPDGAADNGSIAGEDERADREVGSPPSPAPADSITGEKDLTDDAFMNLDELFNGYEGSFVLSGRNSFIYGEDGAFTRVSPYSTYKIFSALFALESGVVTPQETALAWDGLESEFAEWNQDQDLRSAMSSSVTWYFQELDKKLGHAQTTAYLKQAGYGNQNAGSARDIGSFWIDSTLLISPFEQTLMLEKFNEGKLGFSKESTKAVKAAILLEDRGDCRLYGKTGTSDQEEGWFIGFVEAEDVVHYFALYLNGAGAKGSTAAEKTLKILEKMDVL